MDYFTIQASNPAVMDASDVRADHLADAIGSIFPSTTEEAVIVWKRVPVRVSYRYDWSVMIDDVPAMLRPLMSDPTGEQRVFWGSQSFTAEWRLQWSSSTLRIESDWRNVAGEYRDLLNARGPLEMDQEEFVCEWKAILHHTLIAIDTSRISITDTAELQQLRELEQSIPHFGRLYRVD
jgi:hypothetical protein